MLAGVLRIPSQDNSSRYIYIPSCLPPPTSLLYFGRIENTSTHVHLELVSRGPVQGMDTLFVFPEIIVVATGDDDGLRQKGRFFAVGEGGRCVSGHQYTARYVPV